MMIPCFISKNCHIFTKLDQRSMYLSVYVYLYLYIYIYIYSKQLTIPQAPKESFQFLGEFTFFFIKPFCCSKTLVTETSLPISYGAVQLYK